MQQYDLCKLEGKLRHRFRDRELLEEALRHSSYVNELPDSQTRDNERLEFLGDAVLNLIISHLLMQHYPELEEGELSRIRAGLVNESQLADVATRIDLGFHIRLGKGELQTNGRQKKSVLADAFEAVVAAVYLDSGFGSAFDLVKKHFDALITETEAPAAVRDYKSQLQELVQMSRQPLPNYEIVDESGPDHDKTFKVRLTVCQYQTQGIGKSKKAAEQDAARYALALLNQPDIAS